MLSIYTPEITNRIRYIFELFFTEQLRVDHRLVSNLDEFRAIDGPKFCYDSQVLPDTMCFGAVFLLFEKGVNKQEIEVSEYDYLKVFFPVRGEEYVLPFDPFAASFYLVSRYEEYMPHKLDQHGRFPASESLAYREGFLQVPLVNYYIKLVKTKLQERFPDLKFKPRKFKYKPTYDIDSAFAYKNKGLIRNVGGLAQEVLAGEFGNASRRMQVLAGVQPDPFDTYDYLRQLHNKYKLNPAYFFLIGDYDEYDKNISSSITEFQELIKGVADYAEVGVHPSYASNHKPGKLKKEIRRLNRILKRDITISRQHFLMLRFPQTYNRLIEHDILEDYTMGYASALGFRASIASSFHFYSLEQENKTQLKVYPFPIMDATLNYYLKQTPDEAMQAISPIIDEVKQAEGLLITLWHNNSFCEENEWVGWRHVYETMLKTIHE